MEDRESVQSWIQVQVHGRKRNLLGRASTRRDRQFLGKISYKTEKEARERADSLLETQISIRYDPDLPEDSQPVFDTGWPLHD